MKKAGPNTHLCTLLGHDQGLGSRPLSVRQTEWGILAEARVKRTLDGGAKPRWRLVAVVVVVIVGALLACFADQTGPMAPGGRPKGGDTLSLATR